MTYEEAIRHSKAVIPNCTLDYLMEILGSSMSLMYDVTADSDEFDFISMYADTSVLVCVDDIQVTHAMALTLQSVELTPDYKYLDGSVYLSNNDTREIHFRVYKNILVTIQLQYLVGRSCAIGKGPLDLDQALLLAQKRYAAV